LEDIGHCDMPIDDHHQGLDARREPNHYVTGRGGGRDIDLRAHARAGMQLHGRLRDIRGGTLRLAGDLRANLDAADATAERIKDTIDRWIDEQGIDAPREDRYRPVWEPAGDGDGGRAGGGKLDLERAQIRTVVWATGFRSDWSWVKAPAFARDGYPQHARGVSNVRDLYVIGLPWLYTWGSARFAGVARDAEYLAEQIAARARVPAAN
jgi:putative flavoprotein involved in K+ transport